MKQYLDLLNDIMVNGIDTDDRTGTGTRSVFGRQMRFDLSQGFPLMTTKKVNFKNVAIELLWMLSGDTNIKYLLENNIHIWTDWPLKRYNEHLFQTAGAPPVTREYFEQRILNNSHFAEFWGDLGPVYGYQWRRWPGKLSFQYTWDDDFRNVGPGPLPRIKNDGILLEKGILFQDEIDQISQVIHLLKTDPDSRRIIVNAWNPADIERMTISGLPPCHMMFQFYTRKLTSLELDKMAVQFIDGYVPLGHTRTVKAYPTLDIPLNSSSPHQADRLNLPKRALSCHLYIRSNDMFLGSPYNIAAYSLLTHMIAHVCNMVPEEFICTIGNAHIYSNHFDAVTEQLTRDPKPLPILYIKREGHSGCQNEPPIIKDIFDFTFNDFHLVDYNPDPFIKAPVAV